MYYKSWEIQSSRREMEIRKPGLITAVKKLYVWFFSNDSPINRRECNIMIIEFQ